MDIERYKYPVGHYQYPETITPAIIESWIDQIASFPDKLRSETQTLTRDQLDTPYRPEGWTVRQLIHHCADSHINSFIRFKWTLTEDRPVIKAYLQDMWAELPDVSEAPIEPSLDLLRGLHGRWVILLKSLSDTDLEREFIHPKTQRSISVKWNIGLYAWHGRHHLAQITGLKQRNGWK